MKRILSFLLCIILLKAQAFAIHGNLEGTDTGTILTGTYSGTMIPTDSDQGTDIVDANGAVSGTINSIGLFSVAMPISGPGTGTFMIFTEGISYFGTIIAIGSAQSGTIQGIIEATYDYNDFVRNPDTGEPIETTTTDLLTGITTTTPQTQVVTAAIRGTLEATVESNIATIASSSALAANYGRLTGTAVTGRVFPGPNGPDQLVTDKMVTYLVDGTKQSLTADDAATIQAPGTETVLPYLPYFYYYY